MPDAITILYERIEALEAERARLKRDTEQWRQCNALIGFANALIREITQDA